MDGASNEMRASEDAYASDLLRRVARRERVAMERLYGLYQDAVYRVAQVRTGSPVDASQLLQELMLQIWGGAHVWREGDRPRTWILRLVSRAAASRLPADGPLEELPDPSTQALAAPVERNGASENLHTVLRRMPERYRTVLHLAYFEHLGDAEIAKVLETTEAAAAWHRRQGRDALSELVRGTREHDDRARDLFLDAWMRRELRMPPDASPCDFGLDQLKLGMRAVEGQRRRRRLQRRWMRRPLGHLRRWLGFCGASRATVAG